MSSGKHITSFIRVNRTGAVEKVSWFKKKDGEKYSTVEPYNPGAIELYLMAKDKYGEHTLNINP